MRRRQQFAMAHSLLEAQAAALKNWARRQKIEPVPAKEVLPAESQPETTPSFAPRGATEGGAPPRGATEGEALRSLGEAGRRPGFCMRCGRHIGKGVWMHQKTCKG